MGSGTDGSKLLSRHCRSSTVQILLSQKPTLLVSLSWAERETVGYDVLSQGFFKGKAQILVKGKILMCLSLLSQLRAASKAEKWLSEMTCI